MRHCTGGAGVRKGAHLCEYAILGLLVWRALRHGTAEERGRWRWRWAGWAVLWVLLYAASDEVHQVFVPSRQGSVGDVLLDTTGAVIALTGLWAIGRWRERW